MTATEIRVTPKKGFQVFDPALRDYLPAEGREVSETPYWRRRIIDGDVTESAARTPEQKQAEAAAELEAEGKRREAAEAAALEEAERLAKEKAEAGNAGAGSEA